MGCVVPGAPSSRINPDSDDSACQMAIFRAISAQSVSGTLVLRMRRKGKGERSKAKARLRILHSEAQAVDEVLTDYDLREPVLAFLQDRAPKLAGSWH